MSTAVQEIAQEIKETLEARARALIEQMPPHLGAMCSYALRINGFEFAYNRFLHSDITNTTEEDLCKHIIPFLNIS